MTAWGTIDADIETKREDEDMLRLLFESMNPLQTGFITREHVANLLRSAFLSLNIQCPSS
jgi:hypothetical protein